MRYYLFYIVLLWPFFCVSCGSNESNETSEECFSVSENGVHDFGECNRKQELSNTFTLVNQSENAVKITMMKSSCACTWVDNENHIVGQIIQAGSSLDIPVQLKISSSQDSASGKVLVHYHQLDHRGKNIRDGSLTLQVSGTASRDYRIDPQDSNSH